MEKQYRIVDGPESIQGTKEWHEFRKGKIGASDAASIMGVSPWETKLQCWERIQFDIKKPGNAAMKRGSEMEEKARKWVNGILGVGYYPVVLQSTSHPDLIASLDGYFDFGNKVGVLEIKCPGIQAHGEALAGRVPEYYKPQLQHQMDLVGVDSMLYVSFDGEKGVILEVQRDQEYCKELFLAEAAFFASLIDFRPPEPSDKDWVEITDPTASEKAERYKQLSLLIEELETERQEIKELLEPTDNHPRLQIGDLKIQRVVRKGNVDYAKIPELEGVCLETYRKKPISSWRFSF